MIKRRIGVALVAGSLLVGAAGAGIGEAQTSTNPYGQSNPPPTPLQKCLRKAKKKKTAAARKKAKKRCKKRFRKHRR